MKMFGRITKYDMGVGAILSEDGEDYLFTFHDIEGEIGMGDYVSFRAEMVLDCHRAFFVKKVTEKEEVAKDEAHESEIFSKIRALLGGRS